MCRMILGVISVLLINVPCACSGQALVYMERVDGDDYASIIWDERTYIPYCAISRSECGVQIGIVDHDKDDKVYEFKGYPSDEWIINAYIMDSAMLCREANTVAIPEGLESEYEWNSR